MDYTIVTDDDFHYDGSPVNIGGGAVFMRMSLDGSRLII